MHVTAPCLSSTVAPTTGTPVPRSVTTPPRLTGARARPWVAVAPATTVGVAVVGTYPARLAVTVAGPAASGVPGEPVTV